MASFRILQLTDLHVAGAVTRDLDARAHFVRALESTRGLQPDLLVLSGDLADRGERECYSWIREQIAGWACPVIALAGNHDDPAALFDLFPPPGEAGPDRSFRALFGRYEVLCLDSSSGQVSRAQLDWLTQCEPWAADRIVFLHHPPRPAGCRFMDEKYPLENWQETWRALCTTQWLRAVCVGHYHTERTLVAEGLPVLLTPSTLYQIAPDAETFQVESRRGGWRILDFEDGALESRVGYFEGF